MWSRRQQPVLRSQEQEPDRQQPASRSPRPEPLPAQAPSHHGIVHPGLPARIFHRIGFQLRLRRVRPWPKTAVRYSDLGARIGNSSAGVASATLLAFITSQAWRQAATSTPRIWHSLPLSVSSGALPRFDGEKGDVEAGCGALSSTSREMLDAPRRAGSACGSDLSSCALGGPATTTFGSGSGPNGSLRRMAAHAPPSSVLGLRFGAHLDYAGVAAALGISSGTAAVATHRALTALRRKLLEDGR